MADYISSLTGAQMDAALTDMAEHTSEAWAVGERNGTEVSSTDLTYHNNAKYYAEQAARVVPEAGEHVIRYDVSQVLTDEEQAQARANIGAERTGIASNPNLLDNPFFTVNQRGQSSYSSGYTLDRWLIGGGTFTVTKLSGYGINISKPANNPLLYMQTFESARFEVGKTYTLSINVDGVVYSKSFVYDGGSSQYYHSYVDFSGGGFRYRLLQSGTNADLLEFRINDATTAALNVNIYSVMIEPGSTSTLENDAPPDYTTELLKCQRYFQVYKIAGKNDVMDVAFAWSATLAYLSMQAPVVFRTTPTASFKNTRLGTNSNNYPITSIGVNTANSNAITLVLNTSGLTAGAMYLVRSDGTAQATIELSADL